MNTLKRKALALLALGALALGLAPAAPVDAGTAWNSSSCSHAVYTKFICFDAGSDTVVIQTAAGAQTGYLASSTMTPSKGWIAYDVYECNAAAPDYDTAFTTSGAYSLPTSIQYVDNTAGYPPAAGNIYVDPSVHDIIAWLANSQTGYACFIVT